MAVPTDSRARAAADAPGAAPRAFSGCDSAAPQATAPFLTNVENHLGRVTLTAPDNIRRRRARDRRGVQTRPSRLLVSQPGRVSTADLRSLAQETHVPPRRTSGGAPGTARARPTAPSDSTPTAAARERRASAAPPPPIATAASLAPAGAPTEPSPASGTWERRLNVWDEISAPGAADIDVNDPPPAFVAAPPPPPPPAVPASPPPPFTSDDEGAQPRAEADVSSDTEAESPVDAAVMQQRVAWESDRLAGFSLEERVRRMARRLGHAHDGEEPEDATRSDAGQVVPAPPIRAPERLAQLAPVSRAARAPPAPSGAPPAAAPPPGAPPPAFVPRSPSRILQEVRAPARLSGEAAPAALDADSSEEEPRPESSDSEHEWQREHDALQALHQYETDMRNAVRRSRLRALDAERESSSAEMNAAQERLYTAFSELDRNLPRAPPPQLAPSSSMPGLYEASSESTTSDSDVPNAAPQHRFDVPSAPPRVAGSETSSEALHTTSESASSAPSDAESDWGADMPHAPGAHAPARHEAPPQVTRAPPSAAAPVPAPATRAPAPVSAPAPTRAEPPVATPPVATPPVAAPSAAPSAAPRAHLAGEQTAHAPIPPSKPTRPAPIPPSLVPGARQQGPAVPARLPVDHALVQSASGDVLTPTRAAHDAERLDSIPPAPSLAAPASRPPRRAAPPPPPPPPPHVSTSSTTRPLPPPPPSQVPLLRTAYDQLREMQTTPEASPVPTPASEASLASFGAYLEHTMPSVRAEAEPETSRVARPLSHYGGAFTNPRSSAAPLPTHSRLPTITAATRHFPPTRGYTREDAPGGSSAAGADAAPMLPPRRAPSSAGAARLGTPSVGAPHQRTEAAPAVRLEDLQPGRSAPTIRAVNPAAEDRRAPRESPVEAPRAADGAAEGAAGSPSDAATVTDLDVVVAQLDDPASHYEWASLLGEFLGPARTTMLTPEELQNIPVGRVELDQQRVSSSGKLKKKLSVVGVRVDRCGICLQQFREGQPACIFPFHDECTVQLLRTSRLCPLCRQDVAGGDPVP
ncbi:hypothetical protein MOBT1_002165 [Malassezia obtusa]|uniref:RING-type domain-containing protein n=1 Tax=Malassezia obtusa TaxID=76774 RepID=A0AAF0E0M3_9BASI|nr:hypothetical protein MOBT1_002165 [Malassezia obtusa]